MTPPCVVLCRVIALRRTDHRYFEAAAFDIVIFAFLVLFPAIREEELPVVRLFVRIAPFNGQLAQFLLRPCRNAFAPQAVAFFFTVKAWVFPVNLALRVAAFVNKFRDVRVAFPAAHTLAVIVAPIAVFTSLLAALARIVAVGVAEPTIFAGCVATFGAYSIHIVSLHFIPLSTLAAAKSHRHFVRSFVA